MKELAKGITGRCGVGKPIGTCSKIGMKRMCDVETIWKEKREEVQVPLRYNCC